jgi:hypothetical protein
MRLLWYVAGYTERDNERSDDIKSHLRMRNLEKQMQEWKQFWLDHLQRMSSEKTPKQLLYCGAYDPC